MANGIDKIHPARSPAQVVRAHFWSQGGWHSDLATSGPRFLEILARRIPRVSPQIFRGRGLARSVGAGVETPLDAQPSSLGVLGSQEWAYANAGKVRPGD